MTRKEMIERMAEVRYFLIDAKTTREELDLMFDGKREHKYGTNYVAFIPEVEFDGIYNFQCNIRDKDEGGIVHSFRLVERDRFCKITEMRLLDTSRSLDYSKLDIDADNYSFYGVSESTVKDIIMSEIPRLTKNNL